MSARQLHNAHYQLRETIIRYRFHPRYGQTVIVTSRNRRGNDVAVTIRQPDGTLAQLPIAWVAKNPRVSTVITGASTLAQLQSNLGAVAVLPKLTLEVMARIDAITSPLAE